MPSLNSVITVICLIFFSCRVSAADDPGMPMKSACFESSDGVQLCYVEHLLEDVSSPTLVFIPGWSMPVSIWEKQMAYFSGRQSLIVFDPRGQGESEAPLTGYTLDRRSRDLKELLDQFPQRSFVLVCWSLAVLESLAFVDQFGTDRIRGLVFVDNSVGEGPEPPPQRGENPFFVELRTQRKETLRKFIDAIFHVDPGEVQKSILLASAMKMDVEDSIRLLSFGKPRTYWKNVLYQVSVPVLYLVTPKWRTQAELVARNHPSAHVEIFPTAGHALFWDEASRFNEALKNFMSDVRVDTVH